LIIAGRSSSKLDESLEAIKKDAPEAHIRNLLLDLGSFANVRKAAEEVNGWSDVPSIDVLIANAAVMACPWQVTEDGIEMQFATNHLGHFLFTQLIISKIIAAGSGARIVNVSSAGHRFSDVRLDDWNFDVSTFSCFLNVVRASR
jgi:NAD(P)-dependent dehydrogenase (short-subunit alcohol dehydrogenase family)